jgi:hypothetical protein
LQCIQVDARRVDLHLRDHRVTVEQRAPGQRQRAASGQQNWHGRALRAQRDAFELKRGPRKERGCGWAGEVEFQASTARLRLQHRGDALRLQQEVHGDERRRYQQQRGAAGDQQG